MTLDLHTMMVLLSALSLLFSGLLLLVDLHAGHIQGLPQWALGSLCIGVGLGFSYLQIKPPTNQWALVFGASFTLAGSGFQFNGIQAFKTRNYPKSLPGLLAGLGFMQTLWFAIYHPDINGRVIVNSLLFFLINASCARALLIPIEQPLRTAYWFTGISFAVIAGMFLLRATVVILSPNENYGLHSQLSLNPVIFFIAGMAQMCIAFGCVLMVNYRQNADQQRLALTDSLTGAMNRRNLEQQARHLTNYCARTRSCMAVMMLDVDHFKTINDNYGHLLGDEVLKHLTKIAQQCIRGSDYLARYGGEEFCILLPDSDAQHAWTLGERLRQTFADNPVVFGENQLTSTISIGIADSKQVGLSWLALVAAADQAMYAAKQSGRNQVCLYSVADKAY